MYLPGSSHSRRTENRQMVRQEIAQVREPSCTMKPRREKHVCSWSMEARWNTSLAVQWMAFEPKE